MFEMQVFVCFQLDDPNVLPGYHFRDDAMLYYDAIHKYCQSYVKIYYDSVETLKADWEIQSWVAEIVAEKNGEQGGCGLRVSFVSC